MIQMMPKPPKSKRREMKVDKTDREVFFYIDEEKKIKVKCREVFKNGRKVIHFPFWKNDGSQKYETIKRIIYEEMPKSLPRGFLKDWNTGYGFTKVYNHLIYPIQEKFKVEEVIVSEKGSIKIDGKKFFINVKKFDAFYPQIDSLLKKQNQERSILVEEILADIFPSDFKQKDKKYLKDELYSFISRHVGDASNLSEKDVEALFTLASQITQSDFIENKRNVLKAKDVIEEYYIEEVIAEYEKLMNQKTQTSQLEERWQTFFQEHSWIFSQLFSFPVLLFEDKAYAGGKTVENTGSKIADFLYQNKLTKNVAFIEIKTHKTTLLKKKAYRGEDVFSASDELSGAVNQVLDQRDGLQKEFWSLKGKSKKVFESYNPKCIVIAGSLSKLSKGQKKSLELMRSNSKDVEIVTFDEVLEKIKGLESLLFRDSKK